MFQEQLSTRLNSLGWQFLRHPDCLSSAYAPINEVWTNRSGCSGICSRGVNMLHWHCLQGLDQSFSNFFFPQRLMQLKFCMLNGIAEHQRNHNLVYSNVFIPTNLNSKLTFGDKSDVDWVVIFSHFLSY